MDDLFDLLRTVPKLILVGALFCCIASGALLCGGCYAIYWGLSLAERAVEANEREGETTIEPTAPSDRH